MSYHEEQESIENLKAWWAQWGTLTTWVVLLALLAGAGWNGWNYWQRHQASKAAVLYDQVQQAVTNHDKVLAARAATDMEERFGHTAYAQMSALDAAKVLYEAGDEAGAKAQLQWAVDHAKDEEFQQIARLRLAALLLDEKAYDQGLALLAQPLSDAFKGVVADGRGDLLAAAGRRADARAAYRLALDSLPENSDGSGNNKKARALIQFKLEALGG